MNTVVCIGDSLTYGYGVTIPYPNRLAAKFPGVSFVNLGLNGDTAANIDAVRKTVADAYSPSRVIVWAGINDIDLDHSYGTILTNLQNIYTYYKVTKGYSVWAVTVTPQDVNSSDRNTIRDSLNNWIRTSATNVDYVVDAWLAIRDPLNTTKRNPTYLDPSTPNHLNDYGMAAVVAAFPHL